MGRAAQALQEDEGAAGASPVDYFEIDAGFDGDFAGVGNRRLGWCWRHCDHGE